MKWNRITKTVISNNGNYIVYQSEPWEGDPALHIAAKSGKQVLRAEYATEANITNNSEFLIFKILTPENEVKQLKLKNTKKDDMPLNKLGIFSFNKLTTDTVHELKSFKVPQKWDGWIAYQTKTKIEKDTTAGESKKKVKKESGDNGFKLTLRNLETAKTIEYPFVTDYILAKEKQALAFVSTGDDKEFKPGVYMYDLHNENLIQLLEAKGNIKQLVFDKTGSKIAFVADTTDNKKDDFTLFAWYGTGLASEVNIEIPEGMKISENGAIRFAEKNNRVFFGLATIMPEKDTTKLDDETPKLDIWRWNEPSLYSEQLNQRENNLKKSYLTVYHVDNKKTVLLEQEWFSNIELIQNGDCDKLLAWSNRPYAVEEMWLGGPETNDFYLVDINTGKAELIKQALRARLQLSPEGNYVYWYNAEDTSWNTYKISAGIHYKITNPKTVQCADEENDVPGLASSYGDAGWTKGDKTLLVYDRFDLWEISPENESSPVNITQNGRLNNISYRLIDFENMQNRRNDDNESGIDLSKPLFLKGHHEITRADGYYTLEIKKTPKTLISGTYMLNTPIKAKDTDVYIYTRETFDEFPNLWISTGDFKKAKQISNVNPQQEKFLWGSKELYSWVSLDGHKLEGLLIKPANFDPTKKYPMIVNFYEKSSQGLYRHHIPEPHRSTIDYHYYSSNGYIIFNPDIVYKEGYPGEDAYNCVMPGITKLISEGFVDVKSIAAQGHSWGGYQVAYLAIRTNLFAAIESGAPVANMVSAYGGIRLWTGHNRSFQYEHGQSRIGKSIWESPLRYLENSPVFWADKIQTPLLIMHNEDDGAVPFSQGIEFFIALRRLSKPAWLLNYNDADHWPTRLYDKYDFQIRMAQFFDHYLKGKPMPLWMKEGLPAVNKGLEMRYELTE